MLSQPRAVPSPGSGVSQHKENAKVRQHRAVSLGFPVLTLVLSTLNTTLPRVYCSPLRLPSFPPTCCPPGSSDKAGGGWGAGKGRPPLYVTSAAATGIRLSLTLASTGSGLASSVVTAEKGVISRVCRGCALHDLETAKQGPFGLCCLLFSPLQED